MNEELEDQESEVPFESEAIGDDDYELVALCFECLSIIPEKVAEKDKFAMSGGSGVCKFCAGPFRIVPQRAVDSLRHRRRRGEMINPG